jgi:hypothetical protein
LGTPSAAQVVVYHNCEVRHAPRVSRSPKPRRWTFRRAPRRSAGIPSILGAIALAGERDQGAAVSRRTLFHFPDRAQQRVRLGLEQQAISSVFLDGFSRIG